MASRSLAARIITLALAVTVFSSFSSAACPSVAFGGWNPASLVSVADALGVLLVVIQGIRYILSDSAQEKSDVKKGLIYVVIGLLVVHSYQALLNLYCDIAGI